MYLGEWVNASMALIAVMVFAGVPVVSIGGWVVFNALRGDRGRGRIGQG